MHNPIQSYHILSYPIPGTYSRYLKLPAQPRSTYPTPLNANIHDTVMMMMMLLYPIPGRQA